MIKKQHCERKHKNKCKQTLLFLYDYINQFILHEARDYSMAGTILSAAIMIKLNMLKSFASLYQTQSQV